MSPTLGQAFWYARRGVPVFPLKPGTKVPGCRNGVKDATTDVHRVAALFLDGRRPFNIGLACGVKFDVIDIDSPDWDTIDGDTRLASDTLGRATTPRGGLHIYVPPQPGARNAVAMLPGIDYRAAGGYVVAPPSVFLPGEQGTVPGAWSWIDPINLEVTR